MKRLLSILLITFLSFTALAQDCYNPLRAKGDAFYQKGQYEKAINMYLAAMNCPERDVLDDLDEQIQNALDARVKQLATLKAKAEMKEAEARRDQLAAFEARKRADEKTREALANDFVFKARIEKDRATAFRLAEHAHRIDPNNPKALQQLLELTQLQNNDYLPIILYGHTDLVSDAAFSPDGKKIITSSYDGKVMVWSAADGKLIHRIVDPMGFVEDWECVVWNPDGNSFACGGIGFNYDPLIWDANTYELKSGEGHGLEITHINALSYSPDGKLLALITNDGYITVLNAENGKTLNIVNPSEKSTAWPKAISFSPDNSKLVIGNSLGVVTTHKADSFIIIDSLSRHNTAVRSISFSQDGTRFLSAGNDQIIKVFENGSGNELFSVSGMPGGNDFYTAEFSPDGSKILTIDESKKNLLLFDVLGQNEIFSFEGDNDRVYSTVFSPHGKKIVSTGSRTAKIWNLENARPRFSLGTTEEVLNCVAISPDGNYIATNNPGGRIKIWDKNSQRELFTLNGHEGNVNDLEFMPNGRYLVSCSEDGYIKVWDIPMRKLALNLRGHSNSVIDIELIQEGSGAISSGEDGKTIVWDLSNAGKFSVLEENVGREINKGEYFVEVIYSSAYSEKQDIVATCSSNGIRIWTRNDTGIFQENKTIPSYARIIDISQGSNALLQGSGRSITISDPSSGSILFNIDNAHKARINALEFSPDGNYFLSASLDYTIKIWNAKSYQPVAILKGHGHEVTSAKWSNDGNEVISVSKDNKIKVWNWKEEKELLTLHGHPIAIKWSRITPDGKMLLTGDHEFSAKLWDMASQKEIDAPFDKNERVFSGTFSPDGRYLATGGHAGAVKIWDLDENLMSYSFENPGETAWYLSFSNDGKMLATVTKSGNNINHNIRVWDLQSKKVIFSTNQPSESTPSIEFSHDDEFLFFNLSGYFDKVSFQDKKSKFMVWSVAKNEPLRDFHANTAMAKNFGLSSVNTQFAIADESAKIFVWDLDKEEALFSLIGHAPGKTITSISFSPDGSKILTSSEDLTAKIWDSNTGKLLLSVHGEKDKIIDAFFDPVKPKFYTLYPDKIQSWWLDGDSLINEFEHAQHVSHLTPDLLDKYGFYDSFESAGISPDILITQANEARILFTALYYNVLSQRAGRREDKIALFEKTWILLEYLLENGTMHPYEYYEDLMKGMEYMWDE